MGDSLSRFWIRSHRREMMTQCKRTPAVGVPLTRITCVPCERTVKISSNYKCRPWQKQTEVRISQNNLIGPVLSSFIATRLTFLHYIAVLMTAAVKTKEGKLTQKITSKNILTSVLNYTIRTSFSQLQPASRHPREYQIMDWKLSDFPPTKVIIDGANHPWVHLLSPVSCPPGRGGAMGGGGGKGGAKSP